MRGYDCYDPIAFMNPLLVVDIQTGRAIVDRIEEHRANDGWEIIKPQQREFEPLKKAA